MARPRLAWVLGGLVTLTGALCVRNTGACPWDNESYTAEAESLPCVFDAVMGSYPRHSKAFYRARIAAADAVLAWAPAHLDALDTKGIGLLKLGRHPEAEAVMLKRAALAPRAYASHANLGTLYTFTGEWQRALAEIDQALGIEPRAHFGREKYHRLLVEYLRDLQADKTLGMRENFLKLRLTPEQRLAGSHTEFERSGGDPALFDALVAMIAVYGADRVSHVYVALGEALALHGDRRLAWTAYQRAIKLGHPRKAELLRWQKALHEALAKDYERDPVAWLKKFPHFEGLPVPTGEGNGEGYEGIATAYATFSEGSDQLFKQYLRKAQQYTVWEEGEVQKGLPVWREEGLTQLYAKANEVRPRCKSPGVILSQPLPKAKP